MSGKLFQLFVFAKFIAFKSQYSYKKGNQTKFIQGSGNGQRISENCTSRIWEEIEVITVEFNFIRKLVGCISKMKFMYKGNRKRQSCPCS
jgi:hypothetical protein